MIYASKQSVGVYLKNATVMFEGLLFGNASYPNEYIPCILFNV